MKTKRHKTKNMNYNDNTQNLNAQKFSENKEKNLYIHVAQTLIMSLEERTWIIVKVRYIFILA